MLTDLDFPLRFKLAGNAGLYQHGLKVRCWPTTANNCKKLNANGDAGAAFKGGTGAMT